MGTVSRDRERIDSTEGEEQGEEEEGGRSNSGGHSSSKQRTVMPESSLP